MTTPRAIAVAQTCPVRGDVKANIAQHLELVARAAAEGAELLLFPELSLTGYELELADELAFSEHDERLAPLRAAAAAHAMTLVVGAPLRLEGRLHLAAFVIGADGGLAHYGKQRLGAFGPGAAVDGVVPAAEASIFQPLARDCYIDLRGTTAALAICADIGEPAHSERAAARGVRAYLASMFIIPSEFESDAVRLAGYAARHSMLVAMANFGAASGGLDAAGRSSIWSATGELLVQLDDAGVGVGVIRRA